MWTAFKLLPLPVKLGALVGILVAIGAIMFAAYRIGYNKGENISRVEIAKYENKVKDKQVVVEKANAATTVKTVIKYVDRVREVERVVYKNRDVIKTVVPEQFWLSKGWVYAYNQTVQGLDIDAEKASNSLPSTASDRAALVAITANNGICLSNAEQLRSLQDWVRGVQQNAEAANR